MATFHRNNYVIQVEKSREGKCVRIISTRKYFEVLLGYLPQLIEKLEDRLKYETPDNLEQLWEAWATIAFGKTDRVRLVFDLAQNLEPFFKYNKKLRKLASTPIEDNQGSSITPPEHRNHHIVLILDSGGALSKRWERRSGSWKFYHVVFTRDDLEMLVRDLSMALAKPEALLRTDSSKPGAPTPLWEGEAWAIFAPKKPGPVKLSFELATDLEKYHSYKNYIKNKILGYIYGALILTGLLAGYGYLGSLFGFAEVSFSFFIGFIIIACIIGTTIKLKEQFGPKGYVYSVLLVTFLFAGFGYLWIMFGLKKSIERIIAVFPSLIFVIGITIKSKQYFGVRGYYYAILLFAALLAGLYYFVIIFGFDRAVELLIWSSWIILVVFGLILHLRDRFVSKK
jgi:hypothetical protein